MITLIFEIINIYIYKGVGSQTVETSSFMYQK